MNQVGESVGAPDHRVAIARLCLSLRETQGDGGSLSMFRHRGLTDSQAMAWPCMYFCAVQHNSHALKPGVCTSGSRAND